MTYLGYILKSVFVLVCSLVLCVSINRECLGHILLHLLINDINRNLNHGCIQSEQEGHGCRS